MRLLTRVLFLILTFMLVILGRPIQTLAAAESTHAGIHDQASKNVYTLLPCNSAEEMDCIENFFIKYKTGKQDLVKLSNPANGGTMDSRGQYSENPISNWTFLDQNGLSRKIQTQATLSGENFFSTSLNRLYPALWFYIYGLDRSDIEAGLKFQIDLRTSWLKPINAAAYAQDGDLIEKPIPGGRLFSFSGRPFLSTGFTDPTKYSLLGSASSQLKSDYENVTLYFLIDHASSIPGGSVYDSRCANFGYTFESDNGIAAGQPYMENSNSLKFQTSAPHLLSTGVENLGFFSANIHKSYLDCMFPNNSLTKFPFIEISVIDQNGQPELASLSSEIKEGIYRIRATGFHFSSPNIVVSGTNTAPKYASVQSPTPVISPSPIATPSPTGANGVASTPIPTKTPNAPAPLTQFKCVKGKVVKVFTSKVVKCPAGYQKR